MFHVEVQPEEADYQKIVEDRFRGVVANLGEVPLRHQRPL